MSRINVSKRVTRLLKTGVVVLALGLLSTPAAAQGMSGWSPTPGHIARSTAHLIGIVGGLAIVYFANDIRRKTKGSTVEKTSLLVMVGTGLFVLVFLGMELGHSLGIDLWYFTATKLVTKTWWMLTLAGVLVLYTLSYRNLVKEIGV